MANKIHFSSIDSTNTYLKNHYEELDDFTFVSADVQTSGRGRNNRIWKSENGDNLLFSLLIKDPNYFTYFKEISIVSAYTILTVLNEKGVGGLEIKWPNDVYADGQKICGILLEGVSKSEFECLIIGIGVNVNQKVFEGEYLHSPTSLSLMINEDVDISELKEKVYVKLEDNLKSLINGKDYYDEICAYDYLKNKEVYALINEEKKKVKVIGIDKDYSLIIECENKTMNVNSGEISFHI